MPNARQDQRRVAWRAVIVAMLAFASGCAPRDASELRIAVAANFQSVARDLAARFEAETGTEVALSVGSTGKLYAQIRERAPFDVFLAADVERPTRLESDGVAVEGSRVTYALGRLVLWSARGDLGDGAPVLELLESGGVRHLAIANPELAPYGRAAREVLDARGWRGDVGEVVVGESVAQACQFVHSGNAELGLVAAALVRGRGGSSWLVPREWHSPIEQQVVQLTRREAAGAFLRYLQSPSAVRVVRQAGYDVP